MNHLRTLLATGVLSIALLAGMTGPASAAANTATLTIHNIPDTSKCVVTVSGHADIGEHVPENLVVRLRGRDAVHEDALIERDGFSTDPIGDYVVQFIVPCDSLNEDTVGEDEVFARVHVTDPTVGTFTITSNEIRRSF